MDTSALDITFDEHGVCNYCSEMLSRASSVLFWDAVQRRQTLDVLVEKVKKNGKGKPYDCIIGVSGGVDSSMALVRAIELGLRPLAVHMDNGWNSELAQNNIANLVRSLGVDLYTHVIDWDEYRQLMQAFLDADVIDIELLYDNAMLAVNYQRAAKYGLRYILSGVNTVTEGMAMPKTWNWFKYDKRNIQAVGRQFGGVQLRTFPAIGVIDYGWCTLVRGILWIPFLDYFAYNKSDTLDRLKREYGYKPYPYKHYESIFTRFYQGYILPKKFGVDKRRLHLSTLIVSRQMSRGEALETLEDMPYPSGKALEEDILYFIKKMNWTRAQLDEYISRPERRHTDFPSEKPLWDRLERRIVWSQWKLARLFDR
jgi:N-acetyl sugar amidotransferase